MQPSIISPHKQHNPQLWTTACSTLLLVTIIFGALLQLVHHWKEIIHVHPGIMQAMPLFGMLTVAAIMPLGVQLVYLREFAHLNPLIPTQYFRLCKQIYRAFSQNEGKITEKDL